MMNPEDKAEFDRITGLSANELSDSEKDVIRARRDYLSEEQKHVYAEVLATTSDQASAPEEVDGDEPQPTATARRGRKTATV